MRILAPALIALACIAAAAAIPPGAAIADGLAKAQAATDFSAAKRRRPLRSVEQVPRYRHGPGTIACTRGGCSPVPPGCHAVRERTIDDSPSGFQIIVC